jgi:hypothetical protein
MAHPFGWAIALHGTIRSIAFDRLYHRAIMDENAEQEIKQAEERRLAKLKLRQAREGGSTPPHILMEIEDIENKYSIQKVSDKPVFIPSRKWYDSYFFIMLLDVGNRLAAAILLILTFRQIYYVTNDGYLAFGAGITAAAIVLVRSNLIGYIGLRNKRI